tara:strand:- start:696 stop:1466 length:771 start_codon:yes stop_codon:yes gene_type:complete
VAAVQGLRVTILGCGTSGGVPRADGEWGVCDPNEPRNRRRRASILVQSAETNLIVDTAPDLREQCLDAGLKRIDGVLYTHAHADHIMGIDDLRAFMLRQRQAIEVYADAATLGVLTDRFDYVFAGAHGYPAICEPHVIEGPFAVGDLEVTSFQQLHGGMKTLGFRFGSVAYSTDVNELPEDSKAALRDLDVWIVDCLRPEPHWTHAHLDLTLSWIEELKPRRAILTHMTWEFDYHDLKARLPAHVEPAYDGMVIEL